MKHIVTIGHDCLVKRIFVYIIEKRSYSCALLLSLQGMVKLYRGWGFVQKQTQQSGKLDRMVKQILWEEIVKC